MPLCDLVARSRSWLGGSVAIVAAVKAAEARRGRRKEETIDFIATLSDFDNKSNFYQEISFIQWQRQ